MKRPDPDAAARQARNAQRVADIEAGLRGGTVPRMVQTRLADSRQGRLPWIATLTAPELMIARTHGLRPIATVSATCWMHYGWSWTEGHAQGWGTALARLRQEAKAAGANVVLDVKMRTVPLSIESSMDFTLVGTAAFVDGLAPSDDPVVATVPALEFVKLLEADVVPIGIAVGAKYGWLNDWRGGARQIWGGNVESTVLSQFWEGLRQQAIAELRQNALPQGNGVLAHVNFGQLFEFKGDSNNPNRYLGRHIVVATTVDARRGAVIPHEIQMVLDLCGPTTPLTGTPTHHQSYRSTDQEGAI
jgi:uncharacterized protein YbjQ (UPF0145 family)